MNQKSFTSRHIVIKRQKVKDGDSESKKQLVTYKGAPVRLSADFSKETLQARRDWQDAFKVMKGKDLQPRLPHPKLSFRMEGQIKCFPEKVMLKEFIHHHPAIITWNGKGLF